MKQRITSFILALAAIVGNATGQTLSVAPIEAEAGKQTEIVVNANGIAGITALQFNLSLPEGVSLDENAIAKGSAASSHELSVSTLSSGDRLFVLYDMNLNLLKNGELLRLPITVGSDVGTKTGRITLFRAATPEAVSHACEDAEFTITVQSTTEICTIDNSQFTIDTWYSVDGKKLNGEPKEKGIYIRNGRKVVK